MALAIFSGKHTLSVHTNYTSSQMLVLLISSLNKRYNPLMQHQLSLKILINISDSKSNDQMSRLHLQPHSCELMQLASRSERGEEEAIGLGEKVI